MNDKTFREKSEKFVRFAEEYLQKILPNGIKIDELEDYYETKRKENLIDIYESLIYDAQNYQSMPKVIKWALRYKDIKRVLVDFDYNQIKDWNAVELYYIFRTEFNVTSADKANNSWLKWSKSIVDGAKFMAEFKDINDFNNFIRCFEYNIHTRKALPLLIQSKIHGFGFALSCEFLKEIGCNQYPKPDVHIIKICNELGFSNTDPLCVYDAMLKIAENSSVTPAKLDKILWIISSGNFYIHNIQIKGRRDDFIREAKRMM